METLDERERRKEKILLYNTKILCVMHVFNYIQYACASFSGRRLEALLSWYFPPFCSSIALGVKGRDDRSSLKPYTDIYVEKGEKKN